MMMRWRASASLLSIRKEIEKGIPLYQMHRLRAERRDKKSDRCTGVTYICLFGGLIQSLYFPLAATVVNVHISTFRE